MAIMIELPPEIENELSRAASQRGLSLDEYARQIIEQQLPLPESRKDSLWNTLSAGEWEKAFDGWLERLKALRLPPLQEEAFSRASFYEEPD